MMDTTDVESLTESAAFLRDRMEKLRDEIGPKGAATTEHLEKRYMALSAEYRRTITQLEAMERAEASAAISRPIMERFEQRLDELKYAGASQTRS